MKIINKQIIGAAFLIIRLLFINCSRIKSLQQTDSSGKEVELTKQGEGTPTLVFETVDRTNLKGNLTLYRSFTNSSDRFLWMIPFFGEMMKPFL